MGQINPGILILYSAILVCIGNALAYHVSVWRVPSVNLKFKIGAIVGNFLTFASIFALGIAYISYNQHPIYGFFLVLLSPIIGSMSVWLTLTKVGYPHHSDIHRVFECIPCEVVDKSQKLATLIHL